MEIFSFVNLDDNCFVIFLARNSLMIVSASTAMHCNGNMRRGKVPINNSFCEKGECRARSQTHASFRTRLDSGGNVRQ